MAKIWTTNYPATLDTSSNQPAVSNQTDKSDASHVNALSEAVRALESKVGATTPAAGSQGALIAANTADISTNTADISTNTAAIAALSAVQDSVTAYAGGGQANATEITARFARVSTSATHLDSVLLPTATVGLEIEVRNDGAKDVAVFPKSGGQVDALGADTAYYLASGSVQKFVAMTTTQWYTKNRGLRYVDRGKTAAYDFTQADVPQDASIAEYSITSIIPPSAYGKPIQVNARAYHSGSNAGASLWVADNNDPGVSRLYSLQISTNRPSDNIGNIHCTAAGGLFMSANANTNTLGVVVLGWWVEG